MANNVIDWAYKFHLPHHLEKFGLVTLADDATKAGTCFYIGSVRNFARLLCVSERQARRVLRKLESYGLLITTPQERDNGSSTTNVYQLRVETDPKEWKPPADVKAGKRRVAIMSTSAGQVPFAQFESAFNEAAQESLDRHMFNVWFLPLRLVAVEATRLVFRVPNPYFADQWRTPAYQSLLLAASEKAGAKVSKLHFLIDKE